MDVDNAGRPVGFLLFVRKVVRFQVAVVEDDHPPIMDSISDKKSRNGDTLGPVELIV